MPDLLSLPRAAWGSAWGKVGTALAGIAAMWLFGAAGFAWSRAVAIYHLPEAIEVYEQLPAQMQDLRKDNQAIMKQLQRQEYRANTFTGTAQVGDFDGEATVQINVLGEASGYDGAARVRITNLSSPDSPSLVVKIEGNFRNENVNYLIRLSRSAAAKLDIRGTAKVKLEPVEGK